MIADRIKDGLLAPWLILLTELTALPFCAPWQAAFAHDLPPAGLVV